MSRPRRWSVIMLVLLLLGCASTGPKPRQTSFETRRGDAADTNIKLTVGYLEQGRLELALEKIQRALTLNANSAEANTVAGVVYEQIGDMDNAEYHYRRAVELDGDTGQMLNNYGAFLCKRDQYEKGIRHLEKAVQDPFYSTPAAAMTNAGHCAERMGQQQRAEAYYRQALDVDATYPDALFRMSRLLFCRQEAFRARAFLQRYESEAPVTIETLRLGTAIETALNNPETAAEYSRELRRLYPDNAQASPERPICT
ncbi:MAG: type IV pilus biogenesis/stability protein PilW [Xanthomonadales bacterium]|nr:type IV pilus biogenesis/stability protein PilW [Xanthomonadales bacterium]